MTNKIITFSFTQPFIDNLMDFIDREYIKKGKDLSRLAIIFGGKRPALFIKRELAKRLKKSFYPPRFWTIDEFMAYVAQKDKPFSSTEDLDSCFLLYKLAQKKTGQVLKGRETFAQFLPWSREILAFIDQLDLEHIDNQRLMNIEANAQIGYSVPKDINHLLQNIVTLREAYHKALDQAKVFSRGLQYFHAADVVEKSDFSEFDQILFCNFFYFNKSEEIVAQNLLKRNLATFIFQGDQRKWPVLERIARKFNCSITEGEKVDETHFDLKLYAGFDGHSQVAMVREILRKIGDLSKTVIVLPNADHIIPLLSEITHITDDFNISMGYPLKRSSLYSLFELIFKAQLSRKSGRYYSKDYLKALRHPFVKNLKIDIDPNAARILIHKIEEILTGKEKTDISGSLFISLQDVENLDGLYDLAGEMLVRLNIDVKQDELKQLLRKVHELIFVQWEAVETFSAFARSLENFLDVISHQSFLKNYPLNVNIANKMYMLKEELQQVSFQHERFPPEDIFRIFDGKVSREIVAFVGSPLKGLQVLGLFETRSLNFENVVVVDLNEGALPRLNIYEPLIPREVMISLSLDRLELEEEIQRYQFMRLISSAKNVHLVYQESKEKERSRFIEELIWEQQQKKQSLQALGIARGGFQVMPCVAAKQVKKTKSMIEFLRSMTFSASSVNMYLRNPMEFYTNYVLGLREQEDLLDEPQARQVGTFVHELLEESFKPFLHKKLQLDAQFKERLFHRFEEKFNETFVRSMKTDSFLLKSVMAERLSRFMEHEQNSMHRQVEEILYLESVFQDEIPLSCGNIKFKYIVDRVDRLKDGTIMIVDYKTGSIDQMPKSIEHIAHMEFSRESIKEDIRSFQIPLYFHFLDKQFKDKPINAALYNLRTLKLSKFLDDQNTYSREEINRIFLKALDFIICEILDPAVDFIEDESGY